MLPQEEIRGNAYKLGLSQMIAKDFSLIQSDACARVLGYMSSMCNGFCGLKQMLDHLNTNHRIWPISTSSPNWYLREGKYFVEPDVQLLVNYSNQDDGTLNL